MISRTSKYALNVLRCLARNPDARMAAEALARETGVPANYLSKVLSQLRKQGIVEGEKGWGGGFRLLPEGRDRTLQDVVVIFDGVGKTRNEQCILGLTPCDDANPCALHPRWERIRAGFDAMLTETRVSDLVSPSPTGS